MAMVQSCMGSLFKANKRRYNSTIWHHQEASILRQRTMLWLLGDIVPWWSIFWNSEIWSTMAYVVYHISQIVPQHWTIGPGHRALRCCRTIIIISFPPTCPGLRVIAKRMSTWYRNEIISIFVLDIVQRKMVHEWYTRLATISMAYTHGQKSSNTYIFVNFYSCFGVLYNRHRLLGESKIIL